jgi:hypothetical protein
MADQNDTAIQLLFQRVNEPVFTPREGGRVALNVPPSFYTDRYKDAVPDLQSRFGGDEVQVRIPILEVNQPNLAFAEEITKTGSFSLFIQKHREIAGQLVKIFLDLPDKQTFLSVAAYARDRLNPVLYQYALSVAVAHRPDTKNINIPSIVQMFPDRFVQPGTFAALRNEANIATQENRQPVVIEMNFTAGDIEEEQRVAYFREDIGVNAHHWHWHLVYPSEGDARVVNKDRRGELFYYMHSQIMGRYNVERLCNNLARVRRFGNNFRDIIPEGYFPKIIRSVSNRAFPPRPSNSYLQDVDRPETNVEVADLERWRDRIYEAIDQGFCVSTTGQQIPLTPETGIDILGNIVEPSSLSPNIPLYGNLHNEGHNLLSFIHDPDGRHLEELGVVGDNTTAMRDPVFYKLHAFVEQIFIRHKLKLPNYDDQFLRFDGITVQSAQVQVRGNAPANTLLTYWQQSDVDLGTGLDFGPQGNIFARFTHIQHAPFTYQIGVSNLTGANQRGTCRIFIGPTIDERGTALPFNEQRLLMIELDRFVVDLPSGNNTIVRRSDESNLTIPFERTFRPVGLANQPTDPTARAAFQFCGCGWPQHMLLPRGRPEGMTFDLFVMITNFAEDTVNQPYNEQEACSDAAMFCGLRDQLYPDRKPMGYPFDRANRVNNLAAFTAKGTNMRLGQIKIQFSNTYVNK